MVERGIESELLSAFQQTVMDGKRWFELYQHLSQHSPEIESMGADSTFEKGVLESIRFKQDLEHQWRMMNHVFDHLPFAVLFLDQHGKVLHQNYQSKYLLNQVNLLAKLQALCKSSRLEHVVDEEYHVTNLMVERDDDTQNHAYCVGMVPYQDRHHQSFIVYVFDEHIVLDQVTLQNNYQISKAEARALYALIRYGRSELAIAHLHINIETYRTHLKRIMQKTQTHSQAELIKKVMSGSYWLGKMRQLEYTQDTTPLADLIDKTIIEIGERKGKVIFVIPSFFGIAWDLTEDKISYWKLWCLEHDLCLVVLNTHHQISHRDWSKSSLPKICELLAAQIMQYIAHHDLDVTEGVEILGIHTGAAFALNLATHLDLNVRTVKLVSPILPRQYMSKQHFHHAEYINITKINKIPHTAWFAIAPHIVELAAKDMDLYFAKRMERQQHLEDRLKVQRWQNSESLKTLFASYLSKASYKIAFDVNLIDKSWDISHPSHIAVQCFAGTEDIYTNIQSIQHFAEQVHVTAHILPNEKYSLSDRSWQSILLN